MLNFGGVFSFEGDFKKESCHKHSHFFGGTCQLTERKKDEQIGKQTSATVIIMAGQPTPPNVPLSEIRV